MKWSALSVLSVVALVGWQCSATLPVNPSQHMSLLTKLSAAVPQHHLVGRSKRFFEPNTTECYDAYVAFNDYYFATNVGYYAQDLSAMSDAQRFAFCVGSADGGYTAGRMMELLAAEEAACAGQIDNETAYENQFARYSAHLVCLRNVHGDYCMAHIQAVYDGLWLFVDVTNEARDAAAMTAGCDAMRLPGGISSFPGDALLTPAVAGYTCSDALGLVAKRFPDIDAYLALSMPEFVCYKSKGTATPDAYCMATLLEVQRIALSGDASTLHVPLCDKCTQEAYAILGDALYVDHSQTNANMFNLTLMCSTAADPMDGQTKTCAEILFRAIAVAGSLQHCAPSSPTYSPQLCAASDLPAFVGAAGCCTRALLWLDIAAMGIDPAAVDPALASSPDYCPSLDPGKFVVVEFFVSGINASLLIIDLGDPDSQAYLDIRQAFADLLGVPVSDISISVYIPSSLASSSAARRTVHIRAGADANADAAVIVVMVTPSTSAYTVETVQARVDALPPAALVLPGLDAYSAEPGVPVQLAPAGVTIAVKQPGSGSATRQSSDVAPPVTTTSSSSDKLIRPVVLDSQGRVAPLLAMLVCAIAAVF